MNTQEKIKLVFETVCKVVLKKNEQYGDSAITPLGIFCKNSNYQQIASRLDDKLLRLKNLDPNSAAFRDTVVDLIKSELADLAQHGPTKKELERAMRSTRVKMISALESNHGQASAIGDAFLKTGDAEFAFNYANLTEEELNQSVKDIADRYFKT